MSEASFMAQRELAVTDLSGNELEHIPEKTFMYVPKLTWLSLANNKKLKIPDGAPFLSRISLSSFNGFSSLTELYLSYNKITTVEIGAGNLGRPSLMIRYLELSHNNLEEVPRNLTQIQSLQYLGMRHNELRNLSDILLVQKHVKRLNISDNKWECLCEGCGINKFCENISCQVDVCENLNQKDLVHCLSDDETTIVNEPLRKHAVSATESHAPQQNASTTTEDHLFVIIYFFLALCCVLYLVNMCLILRERKKKKLPQYESRAICSSDSCYIAILTAKFFCFNMV
jgi:hypothetical protein